MPSLPKKIVLNLDTEKVFVDGEEFPWYIVEDSVDVSGLMTENAIPALTFSLFAVTIEVVPKRPAKRLECMVPPGADPEDHFRETFPDVELVKYPRAFNRDGMLWVRCDVIDTETTTDK